jgi:protein-S-isoprenylcysteine O-methyltransferase Ste14
LSTLIIISICWLFSEIILTRLLRSAKEENKDQQSLKYLWLTIIIVVTAGVYLGVKRIGFISYGSQLIHYIGLTLIILGLIIRWMAILTLKKYFTVNVAISQGQKIIIFGLYRYIRHPAYLGSLLSFFGLGLAFSNWLSVLMIILPVTAVFFKRIKIEEKVLIDSFGQEYVNYMKHTKKIIPGIH